MNLAQAYKWDGEEEKCDKIINSSEWDVANILFELCVSSLKNCPEEFAQNLKEAAQKGKIEITELYEWPIFHTMRKHDDFNKWIEDAFGYKLNKYRELINHKILDYTPSLTSKMRSPGTALQSPRYCSPLRYLTIARRILISAIR